MAEQKFLAAVFELHRDKQIHLSRPAADVESHLLELLVQKYRRSACVGVGVQGGHEDFQPVPEKPSHRGFVNVVKILPLVFPGIVIFRHKIPPFSADPMFRPIELYHGAVSVKVNRPGLDAECYDLAFECFRIPVSELCRPSSVLTKS
jgi:hypothetical protein